MKELIKKLLKETLDKIIKCSKCGWSWKKSEGGADMYFCHKCGHDNTPDNINEMKNDNLVYHAGESKLTSLDPSKIKGGVRAIHGWGVYFSDSIHKANDYGGVVTTLDISNMNILDTRQPVSEELVLKVKQLAHNTDSSNLSAFYDMLSDLLKKQIGKDIDTARKNIADSNFRWDINQHWSEMMVKLGYDIMKNGYEYVVINFDKANKYLS
jgi:hypothetical protein